MDQNIYDYIIAEEASWKTVRVPITTSKDWNMHEHIERCTNVANGWFHKGKNDGLRPYNDIVTPIKHVAFRLEGFDVKDIIPFVDDVTENYKSFLVKKYHPKWARKNKIDTFIDEVVESSVVYDLALIKDVNSARPELVPLQEIAFCDQTNILSGPICLKHNYSPAELLNFKGIWTDEQIENAIVLGRLEKTVSQSNDQTVKTPGKYIEVYELHGSFPESWLGEGRSPDKYCEQMHIITYYTDKDGKKNGITLFKGKLSKSKFKALVVNPVIGRACGMSLIESLFEEQVWTNYSEIRVKKLLDAAALVLHQTDSDLLANQKLDELKVNTILKHEPGRSVTRVDSTVPNLASFNDHKTRLENSARIKGSASDAQLGTNPVSGTPFALQNLVVQQGQGIHEYRQGKIASFFADELYPDWILKYLVDDMNGGKKFSEELSLDELQEIATQITDCEIEKQIKKTILSGGKVPTREEREVMKELFKKEFLKKGSRRFFEIVKDELESLPVDVYLNIVGKQRYMAQNADKITNIIREVIRNPQAFTQIPGIGKAFNQLIEESGMSPIDFTSIITDVEEKQPKPATLSPITSQVGSEALTK